MKICPILIVLFFACPFSGFSQNLGNYQKLLDKRDSLRKVDQVQTDSINLQKSKIALLLKGLEQNKLESKMSMDSIYTENQKLKSTMVYFLSQMDSSLEVKKIKPGYYCRKLPQLDAEDQFYNQIDWIYVTNDNDVQRFYTMNGEYCLMSMHLSKRPKQIRRQIKRNREIFEQLLANCYEDQTLIYSEVKSPEIISTKNGIDADELLYFVKKGLVRKSWVNGGEFESSKYRFIGK